LRTLPFFGRGIAFPFRIDPATGGVVVTDGLDDQASVGLQYITERWSIRENTDVASNHIGESIAHILLTSPTEHDTLPAFGSKMREAIFEPNSIEFQLSFQFFLKHSTERWEKRAFVPEKGGVKWGKTPYLTDQGILPMLVDIQFLQQQAPGNMVAPFVTTRAARSQEYTPMQLDDHGHDYYSRYFKRASYDVDGTTCLRLKNPRNIPLAPDDVFYKVKHKASWLLISWEIFGDIRFSDLIAEIWVQDAAKAGASRKVMNITDPPPYGTVLRVPSKTRLLTQLTKHE
jgi:hypothetical protein